MASGGNCSSYETLAAIAKQEVDLYAALSDYLEIVEAYAEDENIVSAVRQEWLNKIEPWLIPYELRNVSLTGLSSCIDFNTNGLCTQAGCQKAHRCLLCAEKSHKVSECEYVSALFSDLSGLMGKNVSRTEAIEILENIVDTFRGLNPEDTARLARTNGPDAFWDLHSCPKPASTMQPKPVNYTDQVDSSICYEIAADQMLVCDFKKTPEISSTSYADVFKGELLNKLHNERKLVAVKRYKLLIKDDKLKREQLREESKMLEKSSEYAVRCLGHWFKEDLQFIVMELLPGNLEEYIRNYNSTVLSSYSAFVKSATKQLFVAYKYLHAHGIYHRDVKPQNILYTVDANDSLPRLKLCDFAFSRWKHEMSHPISTTYIISSNENIRWAPPEMKLSGKSSHHLPEKVDVWSLGHVLYYIANEGRGGIFETDANFDEHDCQVVDLIEKNIKPKYPLLADAIRMMMLKDPSKRRRVSELADHPFIWYGKDFRKKLERLYRLKDKNDKLKEAFTKFIDDNTKISKPGSCWCTQLPSHINEIIQSDKIFLPDRKSTSMSKLLFFCRNFMVHYLKSLIEYERSRLSKSTLEVMSPEGLEANAENTFYEQISNIFPSLIICFADFMKHELNHLVDLADKKATSVLESAPSTKLTEFFGNANICDGDLADLLIVSLRQENIEMASFLLHFRSSVLLNERAREAFRIAADHNLIDLSIKILAMAASFGHDGLESIAYSGHRSSDEGRSVVQRAVKEGNFSLVRKLIEVEPSIISWTDINNYNLAHTVAEWGDVSLMELIVEKDPDAVNALDIRKNLPLHLACGNATNPEQIVPLLKSNFAGRFFNQPNRDGATPLIFACKHGNFEGANKLIEFYIDISGTRNFGPSLHQTFISASDKDGNTALHYACKVDNVQLVSMLLKFNANPDLRNIDDQCALTQKYRKLVMRK